MSKISSSSWQPMRGPFSRWPRLADATLAIIVLLWTLCFSDDGPDQNLIFRAASEIPVAALFALALASGALYWRRQRPVIVLGINLAVLAFLMVFNFPTDTWSLPFALYSAGCYTADNRWSYLGVVAALILTTISSTIDGLPTGSIGFAFVFVFLVWYVGRYIRVRREYLRLIQERAAQLEREHVAEARRAVVEERTRIARELHDVVAHRVSLMTVQAGAAKTIASDNLQGARQAMEAVENAGRQALDELRHLMGILRPETEAEGLGPQPGLADIPRLIEQVGETGLDVSLRMDGARADLPARVGLSAYRIVQEALTNVLKHAGSGVKTEVGIEIGEKEINITVLDNGSGATILPGSGHGIAGMRERAQLLGGSLEADRIPSGGFQVLARLPIGE